MTAKELSLSRGPWRVSTQRRGRAIEAADGTTVGAAHIGPGSDVQRWADNANVLAASWSLYQAAKLRAEYVRMNDQFEAKFGDADGFSPEQEPLLDAISAAGKAWLAMEAEAMAIAEGRLLPATQDAEGR